MLFSPQFFAFCDIIDNVFDTFSIFLVVFGQISHNFVKISKVPYGRESV